VIIEIGNEYYKVRYADPGVLRPEDKGLLRSHKVVRNVAGDWYPCDDDDFLIDAEKRTVVAREIGWELRRERVENE
jgi:hypothetical protein